MNNIISEKTYLLNDAYESVKKSAFQALGKYPGYADLIRFDDFARSLTFSTEKLIPVTATKKPRVMLLFSNPHLLSVYQGMFLSPNRNRQENLFWPVMEESGWLPIAKENRNPKQLANICLNSDHQGPFELIFYCYYAFPTDFPVDIKKIFGSAYFNQVIEPESVNEFRNTILNTSVKAVVTFNKDIFNLVSNDRIERYTDCLINGELIQSQINGVDSNIPIFLTFPTGWRYRKQYMHFRKTSLERIRKTICAEANVQANEDTCQ